MQVLDDRDLSVTVDGHLAAHRTRDLSWIVQVPPSGARITSLAAARSALNRRGFEEEPLAGNVALPLNVRPGDALIVEGGTASRVDYWPVNGISRNREAMAVVFVPYAVGPGLLRPPAIGDGFLPRFLRSQPIPESMVNVAKLPSVVDVQALGIDWASWGAAEPTIPYLTVLLQRFAGEQCSGWGTHYETPDSQHPGYGVNVAIVTSQSLVQLCSKATPAEKMPLSMAVVQRGLDLAGAFADGRDNRMVGGGHMPGRKALLVTAGHLLGVEPLTNPSNYIGPMFQEDQAYRAGSWWWGPQWSSVWGFRNYMPFDGSQCALPPSTWGEDESEDHSTWAWMIESYMPQVVGSQVGTALAMRLMGLTQSIGIHLDRVVEQWMAGPTEAAKQQLAAAGIVLPWGKDYSLVKGSGFCAAAWQHHAQ